MGAVVNKKIIGWSTFGTVMLLAGMAAYLAGHRTPAAPSASTPQADGQAKAGMAPAALAAEINPAPAVFARADAGGNTVVEERQTMLGNGDVEHRRLVKRTGKYPDRIVIETLRRDRATGTFVPAGSTEMVADHVLVALRDGVSLDDLKTIAADHGATVARVLSDGRTCVVRLEAPGLDTVDEAVKYFETATASIAYAEPDYVRHLTSIPNDPRYGDLWGMARISMPDAWDLATGSHDSVVAVIDTGMNMAHPDLAANLWVNAIEIPGDGVDNDGNGYVDDVNGWDFVSEDDDPEDGDGHGTHCAGTIGAVGNNANQVVGVCWNVSIMPLRVGTSLGLMDSDIVDGIRYAARNGAKVLSNSYGGTGFSQSVYDAIEYANDRGCIFVAAAGNDTSDNDALPQYPASYDIPNVISVAATDEDDKLATFSNYGATSVDLAAPGVNIVSTYLNGGTDTLQGTSMACPHVAGAMALLTSENEDITPAEAKQLLLESVDEVASLAGKVVTGGRLNVFALFTSANDTDGDDMPDSWETDNGLNPNDPSDAQLDGDGDFLTNLQEYKNACDPNDADSDDDSLIDGWEVLYGFNPRDVMGTLPKLQYLGYNSQCLDAYDVVVTNGYAYVADGAYGLKILDMDNPADPDLVGTYATAGSARGVTVVDDYAFVSDLEKGLFIVDVSDPANPQLAASLATSAMKVDVQGNYAYVAAYTNGLKIASISDPENPSWVGQFITIGLEVFEVKVSGNTAYVGVDGAVARINVSNPASPQLVNNHINGNDGKGIALVGDNVITALNPFGVVAFNDSLGGIGEYLTPGDVEDVAYYDGLIYVADGLKGLRILNALDLADIKFYSGYQNVAAYGVTVANGYAYVAGKAGGLQIFRSSIDSDGDGMYDNWELIHFGSLDQSYTNDFDGDGIINWGEYLANLDPANADQDADGLVDGNQEVRIYLTDPRMADTDSDGLSDSYEVSTNAVDNFYLTDPLKADTDGDGMSDKWEIDHGLNPLADDAAADPDGDGATNLEESQANTDPSNPDTDADGLPDGWEIDMGLNPLFNDAASDPDNDTLTNLAEYQWRTNGLAGISQESTNPNAADTDADGLSDDFEITTSGTNNVYITDPNNADTDGDGMPDAWEIDHSLNPLFNDATGQFDDDNNDGLVNTNDLSNYEEYLNGSDPDNGDTDTDGFYDSWEYAWNTMATNAADPVVVDDNWTNDVPVWVEDHWEGGWPQDPQQSDPDEDGSIDHPFDAIQEAIAVAVDGYTILVREGEYYGFGNRDINPGTLELRILAENTNDVSQTIVKSQGLGAVFIFEGGQTTNTILRGFTIQSSMIGSDCSNGDCGEENGIICRDASSPTIVDCVVQYCRDDAIYCEFNSNPTISNTTIIGIDDNDAVISGTPEDSVHGIYANASTPRIIDCVIEDIYEGCGVYAADSSGLVVINTTIRNTANWHGEGRGIWVVNDSMADIFNATITNCQGGIRCDNSSLMIDRCTLINNIAPDYYTHDGFGYMAMTNIALRANNPASEIVDERHDEENGAGILLMSGSFPTIQNCVIVSNRTVASDPEYSVGSSPKPYYGLGGGIFAGEDCATRTINCTLANNVAMTLGGGITTYGNYVEYLRNDIIWGNVCSNAWLDTSGSNAIFKTQGYPNLNSLHCNEGSSHFDPWYCDISDGYGFVVDRGNFTADPQFVGGGDYHITTNSPCIDKGTFFSAPLYDRDRRPRPLDGDANPNTFHSIDIGAYEYLNIYADSDADGTPDVDEIAAGSDPTTKPQALLNFMALYGLSSMQTLADSDTDGMSNVEEYNAGTNPTNSDTDGDKSPDGDEMIAGTLATDPTSYFYVSDIRPRAEDGCEVVFDSVDGRTYTVYCSTQIGGPWNVLVADEAGDGQPMVIVDPNNEGSCFYKVEVRN